MSSKWIIRRATIDDSNAIVQLHTEVSRDVYHKDKVPGSIWDGDAPSWWKWWHLDNPTKQSCSFVAEDTGRIIGHDALCYTWLNLSGEKKLAAFSWGTMTHPDYVRQGIMRSLWTTKYALAAQDGITLAFGAASELGRMSVLALGWHELEYPNNLMKVLNPRNVVAERTGSEALAAISAVPLDLMLRLWATRKRMRREPIQGNIVETSSFDSRYDHLWAKLKDVLGISIWKDSEYLNWRYIARPDAKYQVLAIEDGEVVQGLVVLRCVDSKYRKYRVGHIVDLLFLPGKEAYALLLIDRAVDYLRESGADIAVCQMLSHIPCYRLLTGSGFLHRGRGSIWMVGKLSEVGGPDVLDVRNWSLTSGDSYGV